MFKSGNVYHQSNQILLQPQSKQRVKLEKSVFCSILRACGLLLQNLNLGDNPVSARCPVSGRIFRHPERISQGEDVDQSELKQAICPPIIPSCHISSCLGGGLKIVRYISASLHASLTAFGNRRMSWSRTSK